TTPGGQTAVVELTLTANADLKVQWNQLGNHVVSVWNDAGAQLPCDAGALLACAPAVGMNQPGMATFSKVPQGRYYLIVQGDAPDGAVQSSGSVSLAISGTPSP
ncbi:MAG: hypothetical protein ACHQ17_14855, partial [Polyangia bacterium]